MLYWLSTGDGQSYGPYDIETLNRLAAEGQLESSAQLCAEGSTRWLPAASVVTGPTRAPRAVPVPGIGAAVVANVAPQFLYISVTRLVCMNIATIGFYNCYWMYRNWRFLKARESFAAWPFWRGIFGIFWIYPLLKRIRAGITPTGGAGEGFQAGSLAMWFIIFTLLGAALTGTPSGSSHLSDGNRIGILFSIVSSMFSIPVQQCINAKIQRASPRPDYYPFSVGHMVFVVYGCFAWLLILTDAGLIDTRY